MGDSKLVIDWDGQKIEFQDIRLTPIMRDIKLTYPPFEWISFHHVLRELNEKEDALSKEAMLLPSRAFRVYEYFDGVETQVMEFRF
jgi:hypothetical protein